MLERTCAWLSQFFLARVVVRTYQFRVKSTKMGTERKIATLQHVCLSVQDDVVVRCTLHSILCAPPPPPPPFCTGRRRSTLSGSRRSRSSNTASKPWWSTSSKTQRLVSERSFFFFFFFSKELAANHEQIPHNKRSVWLRERFRLHPNSAWQRWHWERLTQGTRIGQIATTVCHVSKRLSGNFLHLKLFSCPTDRLVTANSLWQHFNFESSVSY